MARRLGFGSPTGLPLFGETEGLVPSDRYMIDTLGRPTTDGDTANWAIGQGAVSCSPLQLAQCMAGIANGQVLPKLRLVAQVQDATGGVLLAPEPGAREALHADPGAVQVVHDAMRNVVHGSYGTGKRAAVSFCELAGKTGTGQWVKDRNLAWFAGFLPYDNPRFAFAALYEGEPGETVSGGRNAAPMVPRFFNPLSDEIKEILTPPSRALVIVEEEAIPEEGEGILAALPVEPLELEGFEGQIPARAIPVEDDEWDTPPDIPAEDEPGESGEDEPGESGEDDDEETSIPRALPVEEDPEPGVAPDPEAP
jgi:penicillin-binding protein 2